MARYPLNRTDIDQTCVQWRETCLIEDGSLLNAGATIWTANNVNDLYKRIVGSPLVGKEGGGTFDSKLTQQLEGCSPEVRQLAGELLLVYLLFPSSISPSRKRSMVQNILQVDALDQKLTPVEALSQSIGNPGTGFNMRRDLQVGFLLDFAKRIKALDTSERATTLADPWATQVRAEEAPSENRREMMHILLNLLHPEEFERIASSSHKREIAKAFGHLLQGDDDYADLPLDQRILSIRKKIEDLIPKGNTDDGKVDFYDPPLRSVWNSRATDSGEGTTDLEALEWKKQLILYGPPGTGKTYQAKQIAEQLISKAALQSWGIEKFLHEQEHLEDLKRRNFRKIQLHPGYGYSDFIRGVRLNGNETRYEPGALCDLVTEINSAKDEKGLASLPFVLVLDEINRTDLSAMLGEAFSLLERDKRRDPIQLPGINPGEPPAYLALPEDLYVIGTMNEIDQSVETLDFALRRRFLWRECRFDREALLEIIRERWGKDVDDPRFTFDAAQPQLEQFADNAVRLNQAIASMEDLGQPYEIGHSHFADITHFLSAWLTGRSKHYTTTPLWGPKDQPRPPVTDLWNRSLRPLLEQYLVGMDQRKTTMEQLEKAYLGK